MLFSVSEKEFHQHLCAFSRQTAARLRRDTSLSSLERQREQYNIENIPRRSSPVLSAIRVYGLL